MKILAGIISIIIVILFNVLFKKFIEKEKIVIGTIRQPYIYFVSGLFISLMSVIFIVVLYFGLSGSYEEFLVIAIFFLSMFFIGFWVIWYYLSFKITISDDYFTYRNLWFKTKKYLYKDCFIVYKRARIDIYFKNKRIIKLGFFINNYTELTDKLEIKFIPKKKNIMKHLIKKNFKSFKIYNLEYSKSKFELKNINNKKKFSNVLLSISLNCKNSYLKNQGWTISLYLNPEFDYDEKELDEQFQKIAKLMKEEQEKLYFGVIEFVLQYNDGQFKIENISFH